MTKFELRMKEIKDRKLEIRTILEGDSTAEELDAVTEELRTLGEENTKLEARQAALASLSGVEKDPEVRVLDVAGAGTPEKRDHAAMDLETRTQRGKDLKEDRSITVGSSTVTLPKHTSDQINGTFNPVSTLVDRVKQLPLDGGESYEMPFVVSYGVGAYTAQGIDYNDVETIFDAADITKTKITAYQEWPEEAEKLANAPYSVMVEDGIVKAVRTYMSRQILVGAGATGQYVGIFDDDAAGLSTADDLEVSAITNTTLDDIVYGYGGIEEVQDEATLVLNKTDLRDFAKLRSTDGIRIYDIIRTSMNAGTIDNTPYIINSACIAISAGTAGQYAMAYGPLENYLQTIFSDLEVMKSTDYKFKKGLTAYKGVVMAGGNVVAQEGFLRVKKAA